MLVAKFIFVYKMGSGGAEERRSGGVEEQRENNHIVGFVN